VNSFYKKPPQEEDTIVACGVCGHLESKYFWDCGTYYFVRCISCGHIYQNVQPVFRDLKKRYTDDYFSYEKENDQNFFQLMLLGLQDVGFERLETGLETRNFLDIGCATGLLLEYLKRRDWQVRGVEICRPSAEYAIAHRRVPVFIGTLEEAGFPDGEFSFIHFSHLIEHVPEPRSFVKEVYRILKPSGYTLLVTPNVSGFQANIFRNHWRSAIADHLHLFKKSTLTRILTEAGFKILKWQTWGGIAKGLVPAYIKKPIDICAKKFGFGDVILVLVKKES
jgi:2-polyprenyl-3-methyl-5-hydroxy-6-metoxy-1,4-benzoquinol methylase